MNDYKIALGALLDANSKGDIQKQLDAIKDLSVVVSKATLSTDVINDIKRQLTQNGIDLNLVFNNNNVNQITSQAQQIGQRIGQQMSSGINSVIQKGDFKKSFEFSENEINGVAKKAQEHFQKLSNGIVTVKEEMKELDKTSSLNAFTINIKNAKGDIESLRYALKEIKDDTGNVTGHRFEYTNGTINDTNAVKQFEKLNNVITDYQIKLDNLKTKYSNASVDYSGFEAVFNNFKQGIGTVNDLNLAFNTLKNNAEKGVQGLKSQSSSFDPIQQALNNMRDLPSMLQSLQTNMDGLKDKSALAGISVSELTQTYEKLKNEMNQNGGKIPLTEQWTSDYQKLMSTVVSTTEQVKTLKKVEASDNSYVAEQKKYYSKIINANKQIYALKEKILTAGKKETEELERQINNLDRRKDRAYDSISEKKLGSASLELEVYNSEKELKNRLAIKEARLQDKKNAAEQQEIERQIAEYNQRELDYQKQRQQEIERQIAEYNQRELDYQKQRQQYLAQGKAQLEAYNAKINEAATSIQWKIDTGSYDVQISNLETKFKKLGLSEDEVAEKMKNVNSALASMKESGIGQQELIIREQQFNTELVTTSNQLKVMTNEMGLFMSSTQQVNLTTRIQKWLDTNTAATRKARQELQSYLTELNSGQVTKIRGDEIKASFAQVDAQMRSIGKLGNSFFKTIGDGMKKFSYWTSSTYIVMKTIHSVRQAVSTVSELDTALVDLRKTAQMSSSQLNEFYYTANDVAKQMGVTTQEIISQAAAWSRLKFRSAIW